MSTKIKILWAAALLSLLATVSAALPEQIGGQPVPSLAPLVKKVAPAVVNIRVSQTISGRSSPFGDDPFRRFFGIPDEREVASAGSGVIVDAENGYILTNHHVVENADKILISLINEDSLDSDRLGRRDRYRCHQSRSGPSYRSADR
jgi:S1-C subfamily serine protease